jgi:hypothetical protein
MAVATSVRFRPLVFVAAGQPERSELSRLGAIGNSQRAAKEQPGLGTCQVEVALPPRAVRQPRRRPCLSVQDVAAGPGDPSPVDPHQPGRSIPRSHADEEGRAAGPGVAGEAQPRDRHALGRDPGGEDCDRWEHPAGWHESQHSAGAPANGQGRIARHPGAARSPGNTRLRASGLRTRPPASSPMPSPALAMAPRHFSERE